ncbi:MAG: histidine kinase [Burkholderiaceae bacterium]|nr:histidine kinase [Burkholderiaceae bacterium]
MTATATNPSVPARRPPPIVSWRRIRVALLAAVVPALLMSVDSTTPLAVWALRAAMIALGQMLAFGLAERWPARLPGWLERWVFQLIAIAVAAPLCALLAYVVTTGGNPDFASEPRRLTGLAGLTFFGTLIGPWVALGAMLKQREAFAREQALSFDLERSELARQALDARMRLLQAQVQPHFLFNTLANVQALVEAGSPQASHVLGSLITYLRGAVPRLDEPDTTLGQELDLVRAYLELMQMRMPDRLQFSLQADPAALVLRCPPMTLLTLVENAVRHGIDPAEDGGRIDISVQVRDARVHVRVNDSGVGLRSAGHSLGTGLAALRERLQFAFGATAQLRLLAREPRGACAEIDFPAQPRAA